MNGRLNALQSITAGSSPKSPTRLVMPQGTTCWRVDVDGHGRFHWFLKDPGGRIVDLTLDQAEGWWEIPQYEEAKRYYFRAAMSRRGKKLAELLGIIGKAGKA